MLRKIIAATALTASLAIAIAPTAALARDRDHGGWRAPGHHQGQHGSAWANQGGHGRSAYGAHSNSYNRYYGHGGFYNGDHSYRQQGGHGSNQGHGYNQSHYQNEHGQHDQGYGGH